jgi:hypothetical protein
VERESVFSKIYLEKLWGSGTEFEPLSGAGSNPDVARPYVNFVQSIIGKFKISTVLDVGHGDWAMWRDYKFEDTNYIGVDVAHGLSAQNTKNFGSKNIQFLQISADYSLPDADLLLCKDVLQHLSLDDIDAFLSQLSRFNYVIICNDISGLITGLHKAKHYLQIRSRFRVLCKFRSPFYSVSFPFNNSNIETGGYRGLDLEGSYFISKFREFELADRIDFDAEHTDGTKKRILFFKNKKIIRR